MLYVGRCQPSLPLRQASCMPIPAWSICCLLFTICCRLSALSSLVSTVLCLLCAPCSLLPALCSLHIPCCLFTAVCTLLPCSAERRACQVPPCRSHCCFFVCCLLSTSFLLSARAYRHTLPHLHTHTKQVPRRSITTRRRKKGRRGHSVGAADHPLQLLSDLMQFT
jgi:hypothetical protein